MTPKGDFDRKNPSQGTKIMVYYKITCSYTITNTLQCETITEDFRLESYKGPILLQAIFYHHARVGELVSLVRAAA